MSERIACLVADRGLVLHWQNRNGLAVRLPVEPREVGPVLADLGLVLHSPDGCLHSHAVTVQS